jgi:hypothetical protein
MIEQKNDTEKCLISIILFVNEIHNLFDVSKGIAYDSAFLWLHCVWFGSEYVRSSLRKDSHNFQNSYG